MNSRLDKLSKYDVIIWKL